MLRRLLLLLVLALPVPARAERVYVWIENANIPSAATSVTSTIVVHTNNTYRWLGFRDGAGSDATVRRVRIPVTIPSDWGNTFDARVWYTVGGHCSTDSAHCWFSGGEGCTGGLCFTDAAGGTCAWKLYLDAYPDAGDLTAGPSGSGGTVTGAPGVTPLLKMLPSNVVSGVAIKNQSAGGASCSGTLCRNAYALLTIELVSASTSYEYCDVREIELRGN